MSKLYFISQNAVTDSQGKSIIYVSRSVLGDDVIGDIDSDGFTPSSDITEDEAVRISNYISNMTKSQ